MALKESQADAAVSSGRLWSFAGREFDESRLELRVHGELVELELKPLEILLQLLLHAGKVVTKDQLLDAVWPGLTVVEGSLTTAVYKLRHALGDKDSSIVVTVPRVGYRLAASAESQAGRTSALPVELSLNAGTPVPGREHWRLVRSLEVSPNSQVWLAEHPKTRELRVFKFASSASRLKALRREVTVFRYLRESLGERAEFVRIFEWNFETQPYFLESEYGGLNLAMWAESQAGLADAPLDRRLLMLATIAQAVALAHSAGVLHKDLKPANVLVTPAAAGGAGRIKLVDFGSASLIEPSRLKALGITNLGFTQTGAPTIPSLTGTLMYLAPEVFCGQPPGASSDVYALGVMLYQFVVGDFRKPLSPGWETGVPDPLIRGDIADAVCGDPAQRLASPAELAERLLNLGRRRFERQRREQQREMERIAEVKRAAARARRPWVAVAGVALLALAATVYFLKSPRAPAPLVKSVAVLPFQNIGLDHNVDFLRFALPDEVATTLSYTRGLSIRPFAVTSTYVDPKLDLAKAGSAMGVSTIVTGHFLKERDELQVTLEAVDVEKNRLLWRDTLNVSATNMITMQRQITSTTREGLAPALGSSSFAASAAARPQNAEAYGLYLRSIALGSDMIPNQEGITMLERAVALDPNYAPEWQALATRYYYKSRYGGGGEEVMKLSEAAVEQALRLDPNFVLAGALLVEIRVERGRLAQAYQEAKNLVRQRPDSGDAHFAMSYVLRYAGLLNEAESQCETARSLDPHNPGWRSCVAVFEQLGDYEAALDFLHLDDPHSEWSRTHLVQLLLREGRNKEALEVSPTNIPGWKSFAMLQACANHRPANEIAALANAVQPQKDPELNYAFAAHLAYCGQTSAAVPLLRMSIQANHCSYPAMDKDPFFANLRSNSEFAELRSAAIACQKAFLTERERVQVPNQ